MLFFNRQKRGIVNVKMIITEEKILQKRRRCMQPNISEKLRALAERAPFPLYIVGGAVRDALANLPSSQDWDICAPVSAERFSALAEECGLIVNGAYKNTGTVNLTDGKVKMEFTSFRTDRYRRGEHAPASIEFTTDIRTDALRRDFKCNAVYYDIRTGEIVDPLGGVKDIESRTISATRDADEVFSEDGLRLMRLARLAAQRTKSTACAMRTTTG